MPEAVLYGRFSPRPSADECDSVDKQIERCRAYAAGHGYKVVAVHGDKDLSGGRADNRPGLQKAIAEACRCKAVLVVYSLSRFARNTRDAIDLAERLNKAGADLAVIQENVNTRSPMGRFIFTLFSALAQLEREQIAERTSTAMLSASGERPADDQADRCPYGWRVDPLAPDRLAEATEEQAVIARIRQERQKGATLREIAAGLDRAGVRCRGGRWEHSTVRSILRRTRD